MDEPELIPHNFLGLSAAASAYESARVVVLPVPFEATTSYGAGTRGGPDAILAASRQVETFDPETGRDLTDAPIHTHPSVAPALGSPDAMTDRLTAVAGRLYADGKWVLALGGEHAITLGLVRAAAKKHGRLSVLQLDAHADLRDSWEGTPYSHACVMRRIVEDGHRTVHVGIRNACREEVEFAEAHGLPIFWASKFAGSDALLEAADALEGPVYVTVDVDGLDPGVIRTTGTPEPGGLGWWETMRLLERIFKKHPVVGADLVELSAQGDIASDFAAARLAAKLAALAPSRP
ncbi:MAG TPA: agmatinase [Phycisphaerae bacterium]|nr:agmatinase [Phycisphaerae bacterium]